MTIDALAVGCPGSILNVSGDCFPELGCSALVLNRVFIRVVFTSVVAGAYGLVGVQHGFSPVLALVARTANDLGPTQLIFPSLGALVTNARTTFHLLERELLYELSPSIGGSFELLDVLFPISLVMKNLNTSVL